MASQSTAISTRSGHARLLEVFQALSIESPGALDRAAEMSLQAQADGDPHLAVAAAGLVVLMEHLQAALHRHALRMLSVLAAAGPAVADDGEAGWPGLLAWAGAAVAHDYGVLPSWPAADIALLMDRAQGASTDVALALACALGEVCERNGEDAEFARLQARVALREVEPGASPLWRAHWAIVAAWHHAAYARMEDARALLVLAQQSAGEHQLADLAALAALQRARLVEVRTNPTAALAVAQGAVSAADAARAPLRVADLADVRCSVAMRALDFHAAVGHARLAAGYLQVSGVWPGYTVTYRVSEAYALIGAGAADEAVALLQAIQEIPLPRYLSARVHCLVPLAALIATKHRDAATPLPRQELARTIRTLRELEWPGAMSLLPDEMSRIFCEALEQGIEVPWVRAAIRRRGLAAPPSASESWPWPVVVKVMGPFELALDGEAAAARDRDNRKAAPKQLELLHFLAARGTDLVPADTIAQELWPGDGREGRHKALEVTVARLRRWLASDAAVIVRNQHIGLNRERVWVDVQALNERLREFESAEASNPAAVRALEAAVTLYRGACLEQSPHRWAQAAATRWRSRLVAALSRLQGAPGAAGISGRELAARAASSDPEVARAWQGS
jgi:hypothetical protein